MWMRSMPSCWTRTIELPRASTPMCVVLIAVPELPPPEWPKPMACGLALYLLFHAWLVPAARARTKRTRAQRVIMVGSLVVGEKQTRDQEPDKCNQMIKFEVCARMHDRDGSDG